MRMCFLSMVLRSILCLLVFFVSAKIQVTYGQVKFVKRFLVQISNKTYAVEGRTIYLEKKGGIDSVLATFPRLTDSLFSYYSKCIPSQVVSEYASEGLDSTAITAVFPYDDEIWVGFGFYEGEGSDGIGGVGFYNPITNELGLLRHPGLIGFSIAELLITQDTIYAKTIGEYELSISYGNGVVAISRKTLDAVARIPRGNKMLIDNDPSNGSSGNPRYKRPLTELVSDTEFIPRKIHDWWRKARQEIMSLGPRQFIIHTIIFENEFK